jgi:hypothetical protein
MSILDTALMAHLDTVLAGLSDADKAAFFDAMRLSAEAAQSGQAVSPETIAQVTTSCDDWPAVLQALTTFQQLVAQMV